MIPRPHHQNFVEVCKFGVRFEGIFEQKDENNFRLRLIFG
jgi:hypothetical protein